MNNFSIGCSFVGIVTLFVASFGQILFLADFLVGIIVDISLQRLIRFPIPASLFCCFRKSALK